MKIRSQIGKVLNLDKCIGCHTCSVTCKNVWTNREGMEYAWFNNVETKPGIGYPKEWENQKRWNGGWVRPANGRIRPKMGPKWRILAKIFANPDLPEIDDYYEPFTFESEHLQTAPEDRKSTRLTPSHSCTNTLSSYPTLVRHNREAMENAWFNHVETKPGSGYPKEWENQKRWNGGWVRTANGRIRPKMGPKWRILAKIFANPDLPEIDDYYEPFTFDYEHLQTAPEMKTFPTARPRSLITGERMEKINWGQNWEEILGGEFSKRSKDSNFADIEKEI